MSYIHTITTTYKKYAAAISLVFCASMARLQADPDITQLTSNNVTEFSIPYLLSLSQAQVQSATQSWNLSGFQRMSTSQLIALLRYMTTSQINQIGALNRAGLNFSVLASTIDSSLAALISSIDSSLLQGAPFIRYFGTNVQNISPTKLVPNVLKNMSREQVVALSTTQIAGLSPAQVTALRIDQLKALAQTQKQLSAEQIAALSTEQRAAFTTDMTLDQKHAQEKQKNAELIATCAEKALLITNHALTDGNDEETIGQWNRACDSLRNQFVPNTFDTYTLCDRIKNYINPNGQFNQDNYSKLKVSVNSVIYQNIITCDLDVIGDNYHDLGTLLGYTNW